MPNSQLRSLAAAYRDYFPIGAAVSANSLHSHAELLRTQFNSITPENETKFVSVQPRPGEFVFDAADKMVGFASKNGMKMRGHTLVWHNQTPSWVYDENPTREKLIEAMKAHMRNVMSHFGDAMYCWDVVNEAIEDTEAYQMRKTRWLEIIGDDLLDVAFRAAHEISPAMQLYYNDYNEFIPEKRIKIINLLKGMIERGVPVHGFGLQGHVSVFGPDKDEWRRTLDDYARLGLRLQITELDVSLYKAGDSETKYDEPPAELLDMQTDYYAMIFELFREYRAHIDCVTLWGLADDISWLNFRRGQARKNWPLPFDREQNPKPAFFAITDF